MTVGGTFRTRTETDVSGCPGNTCLARSASVCSAPSMEFSCSSRPSRSSAWSAFRDPERCALNIAISGFDKKPGRPSARSRPALRQVVRSKLPLDRRTRERCGAEGHLGGYGAEPPSLGPSRGRSGTSYGLRLDPRCVLGGCGYPETLGRRGRRQHGKLPLPDGTEPLVGMTGESRTRPEKSLSRPRPSPDLSQS